MRLFKYIIAALIVAISAPSLAEGILAKNINCESIDVSKYDDSQIRYVRALCENTSTEAASKITPDDVRKWGSLGKEFSVAITETARGLGVTANEFLMTPAGMLVTLYFMWDIIGGILIGIPILIFVWFLYFRIVTMCKLQEITYEYRPILWGLFNRRKVVSVISRGSVEDVVWTMILLAMGGFLISAIILGTMIF